ncbi:hypothetical protein [Ktedonobacter sp. SOSP1-52]|uniref:hypothetical protein n=1 Tax=Ktedonobacter sp. SOSP1-52 TaxID=2778366 RepID=UPI00191567C3|nr:hypothetical protein [Ktedonobacter sp. SOSP1-52]
MRKPSFRHGVRVSIIASLLGLFILAMSGCGSASGGSTSGNPSSANAVTQTVAPSASATSASKTPTALTTPTTPGTTAILNCGAIKVSALPISGDAKSRDAEECFWHAYQQCQAAILIVNFTGIDTLTRHTVTLGPGTQSGSCHVTEVVQHSIMPQPLKTTGNYSCGSIDRTPQAIVIKACGKDGDITIPLN